jgi:translation initiation factor IF-1
MMFNRTKIHVQDGTYNRAKIHVPDGMFNRTKLHVPANMFTPYITDKLNMHGYYNKANNPCFPLRVGSRIYKFERYKQHLEQFTNSRLYVKIDQNVERNTLSIMCFTLEDLAKAVDYLIAWNDMFKERTHKTEEVPITNSGVKNRIIIISSIIEEMMQDENSFKYPLVTISFDSKNVYISGPSKQVDIAKSSYEQKYVSVFRLDKKRSPVVQLPVVRRNALFLYNNQDTSRDASGKDFIMNKYKDSILNPKCLDEAGEGSDEAGKGSDSDDSDDSEHRPHREMNKSFKAPSKRDSTRLKSSCKQYNDQKAYEQPLYGVVLQLYGGTRTMIRILSKDSIIYLVDIIGRISGSLSRQSKVPGKNRTKVNSQNKLNKGDVVLVSTRDYQSDIVDIISKASNETIRNLIQLKEIPRHYYEEDDDRAIYAEDDDDDDFVIFTDDLDIDQI